MYNKVPMDSKFVERKKEVEEFWGDRDAFGKSIEDRERHPTYMFRDGPPTTNGKPHIGHMLTRTVKDVIPRYRTMEGYKVPRRAGWGTHGLPIELRVEEMLGLDDEGQIEEYGLEPFIAHCEGSVWKYKGIWENFSSIAGSWVDTEHPCVTYGSDYIGPEWWTLKEVWNKDLLYKGFRIVSYCSKCNTPLSSHEMAQSYRDMEEKSAIAHFKIKSEDTYILAWTTTPWTLPSSVALCVNPDKIYVKVQGGDYAYYTAGALLEKVLEGKYMVPEIYWGKELGYKEYEPLFGFVLDICEKQHKEAFYMVCDNYVILTDGTGVTYIASVFGEGDSRVGRKYDLPSVQLVSAKDEMTKEIPWGGTFCKKADPLALKDLDVGGLLFSTLTLEHSYPHYWGCDTSLIYYAHKSWFIKMAAVKEDLIRNSNTISRIPENIGGGRFGD